MSENVIFEKAKWEFVSQGYLIKVHPIMAAISIEECAKALLEKGAELLGHKGIEIFDNSPESEEIYETRQEIFSLDEKTGYFCSTRLVGTSFGSLETSQDYLYKWQFVLEFQKL